MVSSVFRKEKVRAALGKRKREYSLVETPPFSILWYTATTSLSEVYGIIEAFLKECEDATGK